ncbi:FecCD family ABC transporter permease [Infirmifilum uzonense]|uniref:FecCD family ABC transporter permease n=1 Tax=Infirmifilum uzonense TaxID=1550241 RepID=UPI00069B5D47|nr:iron ABC transporter permease [Infirmifilum uzonense]
MSSSASGIEHVLTHLDKRRFFSLFLLSILLIFSIPIAVAFGTVYKPWDVLSYLFGNSQTDAGLVVALRFRRVIAAVIVGALIGGSSMLAQASFRNPLASPFTLGISHAAALGVAVSLLLQVGGLGGAWIISFTRPFFVAFFAFIFAAFQVVLILLLSWWAGLDTRALVLASIAVSFTYQAILYFMQYLVLDEVQLATVIFWTFGDLGKVGWSELTILLVGFPLFAAMYIALHKDLDLIVFGDELAKASGVEPRKMRLTAVIISALGTALATAFVGVLAFLCLLSSHVTRMIVGGRHKFQIPGAMLTGALLLTWSDLLSRTLLAPLVLPVGILLSFIGGPLLVFLLFRVNRSGSD